MQIRTTPENLFYNPPIKIDSQHYDLLKDKSLKPNFELETSNNLKFRHFVFKELGNKYVTLNKIDNKGLNFIFVSRGTIKLRQNYGQKNVIHPYQLGVFSGNSQDIEIEMLAEGDTQFSIISMSVYNGDIQERVLQLIAQSNKESTIKIQSYQTKSFDVKVSESINQLLSIDSNDLPSTLQREGLVSIIFGLQLEFLEDDIRKNSNASCGLSRRELEIVKTIITTINEAPEQHYSLEILCRQSGLPAAKLQEGFKMLQNHTVTTYIKNVRLDMAEKLIKKGELRISEIAYTIGFESRSYFSKIFRDRFKCSPYQYKLGIQCL